MTDDHQRPAIEGGEPALRHPFPARPALEPAGDADPVPALERAAAAFLGLDAACVVACHDGDMAMSLALQAVLPTPLPDTEVIVPALNGRRAARAVLAAGLRVVPAEVDAETALLGQRGLTRALGAATRAVVASHAFGHPAPIGDYRRTVEERLMFVIEDATDALGASYGGSPVGTIGHVAVFAFGEGHLLTGGGSAAGRAGGSGGFVVSSDADRAADVRRRRDAAGDAIDEQAARVVLAELRNAEEALHVRRQLAWHLTCELRTARSVARMPHARWIRHGYDRYVARLSRLTWDRSLDDTIEALRAEGLPFERAVERSLHLDPDVRAALEGDSRGLDEHFVASTRLPEELVALPLHEGLTTIEMEAAAEALRKLSPRPK